MTSQPPNPSTTPFWHVLFPPTRPDDNDNNGPDDLTASNPSSPTAPESPQPISTGPTLLDNLWSAKLSLQATVLQQTQEQQRVLLETVRAEVGKLVERVEMQGKVVGGLREIVERMEKVEKGREVKARRKESKQADTISSIIEVLDKLREQLEVLSTSVSVSIAEKRRSDDSEVEKLDKVVKISEQVMRSLKTVIAPLTLPRECEKCAHGTGGQEKEQKLEVTRNNPATSREVLPSPPLKEIPTLEPEIPAQMDQTTASNPLYKPPPPPEHPNPNTLQPVNNIPEIPVPQPTSRPIGKPVPPKRTLLDDSQDEFEDESQLIIIEQTPVEAARKVGALYEHQDGQGREVERRPQKRRLLESQYEDDDPDF
ncbi:hypothetical protein EX30DRAFT_395037 [Ascodesmis nigricans]|uniref:Uncharacterized protein n=1 Tax=Ascodesmis nigricans TaxID=341454 RepID=A0A4S2N003_9PEZI|nr:hypothetical protein EX30DRAFT_395037 [Ascodesmis nigricans]